MRWYNKKISNGMRVQIVVDRQRCLDYLKETDWYIVREFDNGMETPKEVKDKREEARIALSGD